MTTKRMAKIMKGKDKKYVYGWNELWTTKKGKVKVKVWYHERGKSEKDTLMVYVMKCV